jgi:sugar/nucleoside kinase (ribokinase family)
MAIRYIAAGGMRIDYLITADQQARLHEMGGNAIYSAVGARIWTTDVGILSRVGDTYPEMWLDQLEAAGICTAGVVRVPGYHDMRTFYAYLDSETRVDTEPARHFARLGLPLPEDLRGYVHSTPDQDVEEFTPLAIRPDDLPVAYAEAGAAHLAPQGWASHCALPLALAHRGVRVTLDSGERYVRTPLARQLKRVLQAVHSFLPSEQEVELMWGRVDLWDAAERLAEFGPAFVVIKAGRKGSLLYESSTRRRWLVPAYPVQVVDTTGAGDAYCGGFMVGLEETGDPRLACCYGAVSASFMLQGFGPLSALRYSRREAEQRLGRLRAFVEEVADDRSWDEGMP